MLYRCPDCGQVALNADAQLQFPAQFPQAGGDGGDFPGGALVQPSSPFCIVEVTALIRQGVDFRLERIILHG